MQTQIRATVIVCSLRENSFNRKLAACATQCARGAGATPDLVDPRDLVMPFYDADLEARSGPPGEARSLGARVVGAPTLLVVTPEYNLSVPALLKNAIDWLSRLPERPLHGRAVGLLSTGESPYPGTRVLPELRKIFSALGAFVVPAQVELPFANRAFDERGALLEADAERLVTATVRQALDLGERLSRS
jgi:chromate reductase